MWPTQTKAPVVRNFDPPAERWLAGHRGVDIEGHVGQVIVSPAQGVVAFSGVINHVGIVSIDHPNGIRTTYQPLHERIDAGSVVAKGQKIGVLASDPSGPRLHWGAKTGKYTYVNPMRLLYPKIVLKPW
ncbi:MAG: M23 family metallopeptidase [Actinomycetaceae bacterium]|nr:M23 family metallopeptidase [Actinomycetaceae bacterium]